jgi:cytochrome b
LGALSVWAFLCLLLLQSLTGLISDDEIASTGPLSHLVAGSWVARASAWHIGLGLNLLLALVFIHVLAIIFYQFVKRQSLVQAMLHGDQEHEGQHPASVDSWAARIKALLLALVCAVLVGGLVLRFGN